MQMLTALPRPESRWSVSQAERAFYGQYGWCINAFPTIGEIIIHLREELNRPDLEARGWRRDEVLTNVFLLSCAISDTVDDFLSGPHYDFSQAARVFSPAGVIVRPLNRLMRISSDLRTAAHAGLLRWRSKWETAVVDLAAMLASGAKNSFADSQIRTLLDHRFPSRLLTIRARVPAAFRSQDLTHFDGLALGRKLASECPDRHRPIVVVGLRTAGSYLAPLVRGYLESRDYRNVTTITLRPKQGLSERERQLLAHAAAEGAVVSIVDEPVDSAGTMAKAVESLRKLGFPLGNIRALFPAHPFRRGWREGTPGLALSGLRAITLEPAEWRKRVYLESDAALDQIHHYLESDGQHVASVRVCPADSPVVAELNRQQDPGLHWRLKRVYEAEVERRPGVIEKRWILAKSVGWGWLGYHAFLAGTRLSDFVPRVLGLREGVLFMEWRKREESADVRPPIEAAAAYIADRACHMALGEDPTRDLSEAGRHRGTEELASVLGGAFGWKLTAALKRPRIQQQLAHLPCPVSALIDGKMRKAEWVGNGQVLVKADFEHHGMGKHELNLTDPAYDLADMILQWELGEQDERHLIRGYIEASGDAGVSGRLYLHKLLAGTWAMNQAIRKLNHPALWERRDEINREYLRAWRFLIIHTMRFSAALCRRPDEPRWSEPLSVLDVDGVLDKQIFGFPSTTAAGIEAVSLLASHGRACALNTARSASTLKEYCRAYGFVGGAAEYGSFVWDAITGREQVLATPESLAQMETLKARLREIPGTFLDDDCRFIVRAYTYARGTTVPLPEAVMRGLLTALRLDRLRLHQTYTDSTVIAAECNKGSGLQALLALAGHSGWETHVVGDSEPDLAMFHAATRSFAPSHIGCPGPAHLLGCRIAGRPYQVGLLEIVRSLVHPEGGSCPRCRWPHPALSEADELFRRLLETADRAPMRLLLRSMLDPKAVRSFLH